jgi:hypothetical protein
MVECLSTQLFGTLFAKVERRINNNQTKTKVESTRQLCPNFSNSSPPLTTQSLLHPEREGKGESQKKPLFNRTHQLALHRINLFKKGGFESGRRRRMSKKKHAPFNHKGPP